MLTGADSKSHRFGQMTSDARLLHFIKAPCKKMIMEATKAFCRVWQTERLADKLLPSLRMIKKKRTYSKVNKERIRTCTRLGTTQCRTERCVCRTQKLLYTFTSTPMSPTGLGVIGRSNPEKTLCMACISFSARETARVIPSSRRWRAGTATITPPTPHCRRFSQQNSRAGLSASNTDCRFDRTQEFLPQNPTLPFQAKHRKSGLSSK